MTVSHDSLSNLLQTSRPKQWTKNVLVFAAPGAAGVLDNFTSFAPAVAIFVAFCFASSVSPEASIFFIVFFLLMFVEVIFGWNNGALVICHSLPR